MAWVLFVLGIGFAMVADAPLADLFEDAGDAGAAAPAPAPRPTAASTPSAALTQMVPTERFLAALAEPMTRVRAVLSGIRTTSSWSVPIRLWPLVSSSPITVKGTRLMRMVWSTGSAPPKSCFATVAPMRQTLAALAALGRLEHAPGGERPLPHVEVFGVMP